MEKDLKWGLHWFRRDLRVAGNKALEQNFKRHHGNVVGIFFFDSNFLAREDFSHYRFQFFLETLKSLKDELQSVGSDLLVLDNTPVSGFERLLNELKKINCLPTTISYNEDYEPFARKRDGEIQVLFKQHGQEYISCRDHLLFHPSEIKKKDGGVYTVFTPYSRTWLSVLAEEGKQRLAAERSGLVYLEKRLKGEKQSIFNLTWKNVLGSSLKINSFFQDKIENFLLNNQKKITISIPKAGSIEAFQQLKIFKKKLGQYDSNRDVPALAATSGFSIFLKNGSLTTAQVIAYLKLDETPHSKFLSEIIWREFYYNILFHFPNVEKESFKPDYRKLKWQNNKIWFEAWKKGETGFPIVDAGMRELLTTGRMHNRVRMIVASFLTKDLLIDWRWGEEWFMQQLLDGDLAANNGGWQWSASTGCDAQPYFRIFNPWSQSKKFDPDGIYIKKFIPELKSVNAKLLHEIPNSPLATNYPLPIIEHATQRELALNLFKRE